ncbi:hypothetical protein B9T27_04510 [Acinetobacter sp. ANC 4648]|nr:hypothetical protein B9T27_04510 [Acinetobacter sp. ANC 4648]
MAGAVYLNNELLWKDHSLVEPISRSWNKPQLWNIPQSALHQGKNTLLIRIVGFATQSSGLGEIHLGESTKISKYYEYRIWQHRTLHFINLLFTATLGLIGLFIWLFRRSDSTFGWFALASFTWTIFLSNLLITETPLHLNVWTIAKINVMTVLIYSTSLSLFCWRFAQKRFPRVEKFYTWLIICSAIFIIFIPNSQLGFALSFVFFSGAIIFFLNALSYPFIIFGSKEIEQYLLAFCLMIYLWVGLYDLYLFLVKPKVVFFLTPYAAPVTALFIAITLAMRLAKNVKKIDNFSKTQAIKIIEVSEELSHSLNTQHQLELQNSRLQERIQLSHDLHDSLGGSLVRSMIIVDQSKQQLSNQQFLSILKLLRNDLRQVIDSGSSMGNKTPETPQIWLAPLRHRFIQIFDELDIDSKWNFPKKWINRPSALQCLTLSRVLEEALTNVMKHSKATEISVTLHYLELHQLELIIQDNGVGFDVQATELMGLSVGMQSMKIRMGRIGGQLEIQSSFGKTTLKASIASQFLS